MSETEINEVILFQNGVETTLKDDYQVLEISRDEFSIRFINRRYNSQDRLFYVAQISAFQDETLLESINVGSSKSDTPCFGLGTGMAPSESGSYESLILNGRAHHYLLYENRKSRRLKLLNDYGDYLKLEFNINTLLVEGEEQALFESEISEFNMAIFIDRDLDAVIDPTELHKLKIRFK